jgi:hypothetical protein
LIRTALLVPAKPGAVAAMHGTGGALATHDDAPRSRGPPVAVAVSVAVAVGRRTVALNVPEALVVTVASTRFPTLI